MKFIKNDDESSLFHTKWNCQYHIVFIPKYRRKAIYSKLRSDIGKYIQWDGAFVLGFSHCLYFRIRDFSWWDLELPTEEEMKNGINNLEKVNYKVDYIISHCCPTSIQALLNPSNKKDILTDYLQKISEKCEFKKWYFGHYHDYK